MLLLLGLAAVALVAQILFVPPEGTILWSALVDAGHVPLFSLIALSVLYACFSLANHGGRGRWRFYLAAMAISTALGATSEVIQHYTGGDASVGDLVRDVLGAAAALLLALAFQWQPAPANAGEARAASPAPGRIAWRLLCALLAMTLLGAGFFRAASVAIARVQRDAAFPRICDFQHHWEDTFIETRDAELTRTPPPRGWNRGLAGSVGRLTFRRTKYPQILIHEPCPDWSHYDRIVFEVYSELPAPVRLSLRIDDAESGNDYGSQYNAPLKIHPGANEISIPLRELRRGPRGGQMDLRRMRLILLLAGDPPEPFTLYVDAFRLERDR
jgi:hypothetical protein